MGHKTFHPPATCVRTAGGLQKVPGEVKMAQGKFSRFVSCIEIVEGLSNEFVELK